MVDLIRREPAKFSGFALSLFVVALQVGERYGLPPDISTSLNIACTLGLAWYVAAVVVPTVKLTDAAIEKATNMTTADIAKVAAVKAEAKAHP